MEKRLPFVTIIVPCRNEEKFIEKCLQSIISQDYPKEKLEILVVDGISEDNTRNKIQEIINKIPDTRYQIQLLDNPKKITPAAMNIGIKNAKGDIIIKMDAHSVYEKDYVSKCVKHLIESEADNVGGILKSLPAKNTLWAKAIAITLSHPFGVGGSYFRSGSKEPREVDTVAFGCYWKKMFEKIGLYNEKMAKIEDLELNYRLRKAGGKIMLFPDIIAYYYPSSENFKEFFLHNFTDGIWTTYSLKYGFKTSLRHYLPLIFVLTLPLSIWPYTLISLLSSFQIAVRENDFRLFFLMPLVFFLRHFGYGLGSIFGLLALLFRQSFDKML